MAGSTLASPSGDIASAGAGAAVLTAPGGPPPVAGRRKSVSLLQDIWRRFQRHKLAVTGAFILLVIILGVAFGPLIWKVPINEIDFWRD